MGKESRKSAGLGVGAGLCARPVTGGHGGPPLLLLCLLVLFGCGKPAEKGPTPQTWPEIEKAARGQRVNMMMWTGDPFINGYMEKWVKPRLAERHGVELEIAGGQGNTIVTLLMGEIEAGKKDSAIDLVWINGETFYQLRQIGALHGPFTDILPNARFIDFSNPFIGIDFQRKIEGYECPWGNVQLALIYDSARVAEPPRDRAALEAWVKAHPGRFTFDNSFTGMTLLKSLLAEMAGGKTSLDGPFDEAKYRLHSAELWAWLNSVKPDFWKRGETFPGSVAQLHQLFAAGEVDFTMSNNDGEVDNKILQGLFPKTARAYVLASGTIQNSHYLGVPRRSPHKAAALVAIDFLISPEAQLEKLDPRVWGDGTVLDLPRLPPEWQARFANLAGRVAAPRREEIQDKAIAEPDAEYMLRIFEDFRKYVIEG
jgi:putative spermidine/putrescine transport system substrate-binding protein